MTLRRIGCPGEAQGERTVFSALSSRLQTTRKQVRRRVAGAGISMRMRMHRTW